LYNVDDGEHGVGLHLQPLLHALMSLLVMLLGPGDLPNLRLCVASDISCSSGMSSRMLKQWGAWIGSPSSACNSWPIWWSGSLLGAKMWGCLW